jgi:hypothetical protein
VRGACAAGRRRESGASLFLRSLEEGGGKDVGPAELLFLYPRCVSSSSGSCGAGGACAFLLDFFCDFHFRKGLEEDVEGELPSPPVPSSS